MFRARHAAEDLADRPRSRSAGRQATPIPLNVLLRTGGSPLFLRRYRVVAARRGDGDVVDTFALLGEEPREDALVDARPTAAPDRGPSSKAPGQGDPGAPGAID
jgi:hypothetical protein